MSDVPSLESRVTSLESVLAGMLNDPRVARRMTAAPAVREAVGEAVTIEMAQVSALLAQIHNDLLTLPAAIAEAIRSTEG